jgi:transcription elongation GreA/GreB family factor
MEVALEADAEKRSYWILGDGEHHLGDTVISHQAPIGRALLGRVAGDTVELGEGAQRRPWRVVSVTRRLPADTSSAS